MYRRLLVPLDGSPFSEYALAMASSIARTCGATLCLAHVHLPALVFIPGAMPVLNMEFDAELRASERRYLDTLAQRLRDEGVGAETALLDVPVVPTLLEYAQAQNIDLIVMTTHGRSGWSRFWLGSTADRLVRLASVPLLLMRPHETEASASPPQTYRILVALDGSALSERILEHAIALGTVLNAEYTLLHIIEPIPSDEEHARYGVVLGEEAQRQARQAAEGYVEGVAEKLRGQGLRVSTIIEIGQPADVITATARDGGYSLIAMETHGRGGFERLYLGSVTNRMLSTSTTPMLVHRPHEPEE